MLVDATREWRPTVQSPLPASSIGTGCGYYRVPTLTPLPAAAIHRRSSFHAAPPHSRRSVHRRRRPSLTREGAVRDAAASSSGSPSHASGAASQPHRPGPVNLVLEPPLRPRPRPPLPAALLGDLLRRASRLASTPTPTATSARRPNLARSYLLCSRAITGESPRLATSILRP